MIELVVGGYGLVGSTLYKLLSDGSQAVWRTYSKDGYRNDAHSKLLDLRDDYSMTRVLREVSPDVVYICAGNTNVDACEGSKDAFDVNLTGTMRLVELCRNSRLKNIRIVFFSSSYVFDGVQETPYKEQDKPRPINDYGLCKMEIEGAVLNSDGLVIRTVGVFGNDPKNFMSQILAVRKYDSIRVPDDQYLNPIHADDLVKITKVLAHMEVAGIIHVAGDVCMSKFDWARQIQLYHPNGLGKIRPSYGAKQAARRPENGCLSTNRLSGSFRIPTPNFHHTLTRAISGH